MSKRKSNLIEDRTSFKPFNYPWAYDAWLKHEQSHWLHSEVPMAEDVVREYCTNHRPTPYTIFRFYNVIGSEGFAPTNPDGLMYNLIMAMQSKEFTVFGNDYDVSPDGTCIRDYVHVNEICDSLKQAIEKPSNQIECLGHGVGYTVREIVSLFQIQIYFS